MPFAPGLFSILAAIGVNGLVGVVTGGLLVGIYSVVGRLLPNKAG